ncbi:hypothetical protein K0M31_004017 [Melipona bicolor]|uniref:Uncharacterized protein n=1 Tax=Melipona bicolor TaxID=60889 RepID=A0AA40FY01_9HYME|nr:hypothetical protein K0M31_004017 [Melipona bicolor]
MSGQVQGTLLDVLKKKMRQTKEEMEKYKDECEEYQKRLQVEVIRREEVSEKITSSPVSCSFSPLMNRLDRTTFGKKRSKRRKFGLESFLNFSKEMVGKNQTFLSDNSRVGTLEDTIP